jgi:hypothetical protein
VTIPRISREIYHGSFTKLIDAVRWWVADGPDLEQKRLADVRAIAEHIFSQPQLDVALALPVGQQLNTLCSVQGFRGGL